MATNPYFSTIAIESETDLQESLVIENIQMFGVDVLFIPLETFDVDPVLLEPKNIVYQRSFAIEAYLPENGETEGQQEIMSKFGFRVNRSIDVLISKKRFSEIVPDKVRPLEGDLIYIGDPYSPHNSFINTLFEIKSVSYQNPEWVLGHHYTYKLTCEAYVYNFEKFETDIPALDQFDMTGIDSSDTRVKNLEENASNIAMENAKIGLVRFDKKNPLTGL